MNLTSENASVLRFPDAAYDVVAIAASAGGLNAISRVLATLDTRFPAAIMLVQHLDRNYKSMLVEILQRRTPLQVKQAVAGSRLEAATVFIAPPNFHLLVGSDGVIELTQTEPVHFVRPSADSLFESVSASFHARAIAVVLTGTGRDGAQGVQAIHREKGCVIAQDIETSEYNGMPGAAIETGVVDYVLPLSAIGAAVTALVRFGRLNSLTEKPD